MSNYFHQFIKGSRVVHMGWGEGTVIEATDAYIRVEYDLTKEIGRYEKACFHALGKYLSLLDAQVSR